MALVLIAALSYVAWATSNNWNASQQNARQIQSNAQRYERERCVGLDVASGIKCIADTREAAANQERDEADLYAQRQMAVWAFLVAITAFVSIPLSLTGIFFVWRSLSEMRAQRAISQEALVAANVANSQTLDALNQEQANVVRQLRAYLDVESAKIVYSLSNRAVTTLIIKNTGQTPARDVLSVIFNEILTLPVNEFPPTDFSEAQSKMSVRRDGQVVMEMPVISEHISSPVIQSFQREEFAIFMWGEVRYKDIFWPETEERVTKFRFKSNKMGHKPDKQDALACSEGNEST